MQRNKIPVVEKQVRYSGDCPFAFRSCQSCESGIYNDGDARVLYRVEECKDNQIRQIMLDKSGLYGDALHERFNTAAIDMHNKGLYEYLQVKWDMKKWLYIWCKDNGTGKSYTGNAIANMLIDRQVQPCVMREIDMASELKATFDDISGETEYALMGKWKCIPVLIIQDFGKQGSKSEWWPQHVFDIVDYRLINRFTVVITSNFPLTRETMELRFGENHGPAIHSRLNGICLTVEMDGPDRRIEERGKSA